MQVLPSKELLSEVLDKGKGSITKIEYNPSKTIVEYEQLERYWNSINIYELAHKCKEWARRHSYFILSQPDDNETSLEYYAVIDTFIDGVYTSNIFNCREESEPEAIFKACEWILKEMK